MSTSRRSISVLKALIAQKNQTRAVTYIPQPGDVALRPVTLMPGDGIGPVVTDAVEQVMEAMYAWFTSRSTKFTATMKRLPEEVIDSIKKNKVCLKGGLKTPMGRGVSSLNMQLRKEFDLYASLVNCCNLPGLSTRHENVVIIVIRENAKKDYSGLEHEVVPGVVESLMKEVTAFHKASIMKLADGLLLESCRDVATKYPSIKYNEVIVDNCCMHLVSKPEQLDVMGASAGHVGKEKIMQQRKVNPVALLLSSHLRFPSFADRLKNAVKRVISEGKYRMKDISRDNTTEEVFDAVIAKLD